MTLQPAEYIVEIAIGLAWVSLIRDILTLKAAREGRSTNQGIWMRAMLLSLPLIVLSILTVKLAIRLMFS
jgi:hypothetical protein